MTDPGWAAEMSKLTVGLTVLLVAYAVAHKQRLKRRTKKAASVDPDKLWPKVPGMERGSVLTEQGVRLATFRFDAQHPKAAAILVHGVGVSCRFEFLRTTCDGGLRDRYEDSALDIMRRAGISILGYDHQSHGSSESLEPGVRCYIDQFDDLCRDLLLVHETHRCASRRPPLGVRLFLSLFAVSRRFSLCNLHATSRSPPSRRALPCRFFLCRVALLCLVLRRRRRLPFPCSRCFFRLSAQLRPPRSSRRILAPRVYRALLEQGRVF